jgi:hypothetical protein
LDLSLSHLPGAKTVSLRRRHPNNRKTFRIHKVFLKTIFVYKAASYGTGHFNLIADLSGYTALTETHGSFSAADLIDKYVEIVNEALVGTSRLQERVGDEVMIMATHADDLLATADVLLQRTTEQCNFLQVHGALHYGRLLKRNSSYFGSALNLTSRVAAQAPGGNLFLYSGFL